jgi:hypothetical protein
MKKTKTLVTSVVLALVMLLTSIATLGMQSFKGASALSSDYFGEPDVIYYFTDSYPILKDEALDCAGRSYRIFYDYQYHVDNDSLGDLYGEDYFSGFDDSCIVIFEIKTTLIDSGILYEIFEMLKSQGCIVIFVSAYDLTEYSDTDFMDYVDGFMKCQGDLFKDFVRYAVLDMLNRCDDSSFNILIDSRFVDAVNYKTFEEMYQHSYYLPALIEVLCEQNHIKFNEDNLTEIINVLKASFSLFVNTSGDEYVDILNVDNPYVDTYYNFTKLSDLLLIRDELQWCAMGIWNLEYDFYHLLFTIQNNDGYIIPVYVWDMDSSIDYPGGLIVITDSDLRKLFEETDDVRLKDSQKLIDLLRSIVH